MSGEVVALGAAGALAGLASGWLGVRLERVEKLHEEEEEDRRAYDREMDELIAAAARDGGKVPVREPWEYERYGWTWLEWALSPLLGAVTFAWFTAIAVSHAAVAPAGAPVQRLLLIHLVWLALFVHITVFDIKHRLILNRITYPGIALALAVSLITPNVGLLAALTGAVAVFVLFFAQNLALGSRVIGRGDAKLGAILGAVTGLWLNPSNLDALWAVMAAFIFGGFGAVAVLLFRSVGATFRARNPLQVPGLFLRQLHRSMREPIPYGPFLCAGAAILMLNNPG